MSFILLIGAGHDLYERGLASAVFTDNGCLLYTSCLDYLDDMAGLLRGAERGLVFTHIVNELHDIPVHKRLVHLQVYRGYALRSHSHYGVLKKCGVIELAFLNLALRSVYGGGHHVLSACKGRIEHAVDVVAKVKQEGKVVVNFALNYLLAKLELLHYLAAHAGYALNRTHAVSYTHLAVYKRQSPMCT